MEQLSATYKEEENFKTTGMHSSESMEATFFLNHISTMWTYKLYERLRPHTSLDKHAASQLRDLLWDVGAANAGPQWQMEPIPKVSRKPIMAVRFQPPTTLGQGNTFTEH